MGKVCPALPMIRQAEALTGLRNRADGKKKKCTGNTAKDHDTCPDKRPDKGAQGARNAPFRINARLNWAQKNKAA
ncbi:hypothetical protein [Acetobacter senegalensis]|uniref:hypothetical protein n=1 Tax=Acetobacter senegalensis TaxID=446692 RepID=UPI0012E78EEE|nr:hypothetical protein [Acetobacter senegalensis]